MSQYTSSLNCGLATYPDHGSCKKCPEFCLSCQSLDKCDTCYPGYMEILNSCFPQCATPEFAFLDKDNQITCKIVNHTIIEKTEEIFDTFESTFPYHTQILSFNSKVESIEVSLWLKFSEFGDKNPETLIFWTNSLSPVNESINQPKIFEMTMNEDMLSMPYNHSPFQKVIEKSKWYYVSVYIEFPSTYLPYKTTALFITDLDGKEPYFLRNEVIPSSEIFIYSSTILHLGTARENSRIKYTIEKMKVTKLFEKEKYLGDIKVVYFSNGESWFMEYIIKTESKIIGDQIVETYNRNESINPGNSLILEKLPSRTSLILIFEFLIYDLDLPMSLIDFKLDKNTIYSASLIIHENMVKLNSSGILSPLSSNIFFLSIFMIKNENSFLLFNEHFHKYYEGNKLEIIFHGRSENNFKNIFFAFSLNPSITQNLIFIHDKPTIIQANIYQEFPSRKIRNIEFNFSSPRLKYCSQDDLNPYYLLSKIECNDPSVTKCLQSIPNCHICRDEETCARCPNVSRFIFEGKCRENCPEGYCAESLECKPCEKMERIYDNDCGGLFTHCLNTHSCQECSQKILNMGCILRETETCQPCDQNCRACYLSKGQKLCLECEINFFLRNNSCVDTCLGTEVVSGTSCVFQCKENAQIEIEKFCVECDRLDKGLIPIYKCPNKCQSSIWLDLNKTCLNVIYQNCIFYQDSECKACSADEYIYKGQCISRSHIDPLNSIINNIGILAPFGLGNLITGNMDKKLKYCSFQSQGQVNNLVCTLNSAEKNLKPQKVIPKRLKIPLRYYCPEYIEGMKIVHVNDTCIKIPNTHYYVINPRKIFEEHHKMFQNFQKISNLVHLKLCKGEDSITNCLYECPQGYYESNGFCFSCEKDEFICDKDHKIKKEEYYVGLFDNTEPHDQSTFLMIINKKGDLELAMTKEEKCPELCKTCYRTENQVICTSCINEEFVLDLDYFQCKCKKKFRMYDTRTKKCTKYCPKDLFIKEHECLESCDHAIIKSSFHFNIFQHGKSCYADCPVGSIPVLNFQTLRSPKCLDDHDFINTIFDSKTRDIQRYEYQRIIITLWNKGLIKIHVLNQAGLINKDFLESLKLFNFKDEKIALNSLSLLIIMTAYHTYLNIPSSDLRNLGLNILAQNQKNLNVVYKFAYLSMILHYNDFYLVTYSELKQEYSTKNESVILYFNSDKKSNQDIKIEITCESEKTCMVLSDYFYLEDGLIVSLRIENVESSDANSKNYKPKIYIENEKSFNIFISNLTSEMPVKIESYEIVDIFEGCFYFLFFTNMDVSNQIISIMIEDDSFYSETGRESFENIPYSHESFTVFFVVLCCIIGIFFLVSVYKYLKRKLEEGTTKIKFVQMTRRIEYDDNNENEDIDEEEFS